VPAPVAYWVLPSRKLCSCACASHSKDDSMGGSIIWQKGCEKDKLLTNLKIRPGSLSLRLRTLSTEFTRLKSNFVTSTYLQKAVRLLERIASVLTSSNTPKFVSVSYNRHTLDWPLDNGLENSGFKTPFCVVTYVTVLWDFWKEERCSSSVTQLLVLANSLTATSQYTHFLWKLTCCAVEWPKIGIYILSSWLQP